MTDLQEFSTDNQTLDVRDKIQERLEQELADLVPCILLELKGLQESIVEDDLLWYFHENDVEEDKVDITVDRFVRLFKDKLKFYVETKKKSNKTIEDYEANASPDNDPMFKREMSFKYHNYNPEDDTFKIIVYVAKKGNLVPKNKTIHSSEFEQLTEGEKQQYEKKHTIRTRHLLQTAKEKSFKKGFRTDRLAWIDYEKKKVYVRMLNNESNAAYDLDYNLEKLDQDVEFFLREQLYDKFSIFFEDLVFYKYAMDAEDQKKIATDFQSQQYQRWEKLKNSLIEYYNTSIEGSDNWANIVMVWEEMGKQALRSYAEEKHLLDKAYKEFLTYSFINDEGWTIDREDGVMLREDFDGTEGEVVGIFHDKYDEDVRYEYIDIEDLDIEDLEQ